MYCDIKNISDILGYRQLYLFSVLTTFLLHQLSIIDFNVTITTEILAGSLAKFCHLADRHMNCYRKKQIHLHLSC